MSKLRRSRVSSNLARELTDKLDGSAEPHSRLSALPWWDLPHGGDMPSRVHSLCPGIDHIYLSPALRDPLSLFIGTESSVASSAAAVSYWDLTVSGHLHLGC